MIRRVLGLFVLIFFGFLTKTAHAEPMTLMGMALAPWLLGTLGAGAIAGTGAATTGKGGNWWNPMDWFGGGQKAEPGGWNWLQSPQYAGVDPAMGSVWDFIRQNMDRMAEGKMSTYMEKLSPILKQQGLRGIQDTFFGTPTTPGAFSLQKGYDISRGLGKGGAAGQNYGAQLYKWEEQNQMLDEAINKMQYEDMAKGAYGFPQMAASMPRGPQGQWASYGETAAQAGPMEQYLGAMSSMAPWFMGGKKTGTTPTGGGDSSGFSFTGMDYSPMNLGSMTQYPTNSYMNIQGPYGAGNMWDSLFSSFGNSAPTTTPLPITTNPLGNSMYGGNSYWNF